MSYVRERLPIRWIGYVIMPEHVHLIVQTEGLDEGEVSPISTVLRELKGVSGRWCKEALRSVWRDQRTLGSGPVDAWATGTGERPFWKPRGYDFNLLERPTLLEKLDYIHANPVRRRLVSGALQWPWSSHRFYELNDSSLIAMDRESAAALMQ